MKLQPWGRAAAMLLTLSVSVSMTSVARAQELRWKRLVGNVQIGDGIGLSTSGPTPPIISAPVLVVGAGTWVDDGGSVNVNLNNGHVAFDVGGLVQSVGSVFSAADGTTLSPPLLGIQLGTTVGVTEVKGTLVCNVDGTFGPNSVLVDTPVTTLDTQGNAHFSGSFAASSIPSVCSSISPTTLQPDDAFLIRMASCREGNPCPFANLYIAFGASLRVKD
jgi:hypothetical protein